MFVCVHVHAVHEGINNPRYKLHETDEMSSEFTARELISLARGKMTPDVV